MSPSSASTASPWAAHVDPSLTTVSQPMQLLGETAAGLLLSRLRDPRGGAGRAAAASSDSPKERVTMSLAVRFQGIEKQFGPVRVLHGVSFQLAPGRIYGLLGENGAGMMKILAGYERATAGELYIDERARDFASSRDAEQAGIVLIHQELNLADHLSIVQNMFLGHELKKGLFLDEPAMRDAARARLTDVGLHKHPDTRVRDLIVAEKQLVEIAKAMLREARLLVMDEPTAALTPAETQRLFGLMARLKDAGTTIVYISHKLGEVERVTDEVIVMRDGRFVARAPTGELTRQQMANLMVGREVSDMFPAKPALADDAPVTLRVEQASVPGRAHDVSFSVREGEVFGFAGLVGAGRTELFEALVGLRPLSAGDASS
ncbi:Ribose ABC transport system, ATP-binding protein RbsA [Candidatus Paraburkholderia kirkii]|nr:Ribose ABC transport system, ATP-binding protein RbsA [Candidatus Paraburkholderia kirkii]